HILVFIEKLLKLLHPFMPFITEEIWHYLKDRKDRESIMRTRLPEAGLVDERRIGQFERIKQVVTAIRNIRNEKQLAVKEELKLGYIINEGDFNPDFETVIMKLANISNLEELTEKPEGAVSFIVKNIEYYLFIGDKIDVEAEILKLTEELNYTRGFLNSVLKKLNNERFVQGAPEAVVHKERVKRADAESKIAALEKQIETLNGKMG
ncbi:MAG: class I tRNA ligase family protein, partial [Bacteroidales bacterium]